MAIFRNTQDASRFESFRARTGLASEAQQTFDAISPKDIVAAFNEAQEQGLKPRETADFLWVRFGDDTIQVMADGVRCLTALWEAAWDTGQGDRMITELDTIPAVTLEKIYQKPTFLPSRTLEKIGPLLRSDDGGAAIHNGEPRSPGRTRRRRTRGTTTPSSVPTPS